MDIPVRHLPHDGQECPSSIVPGNLYAGAYATRPDGRATVGGPHVLRITGFDGIEVSDESPGGRPLFAEYTIAVELVDRETQLDIKVPAVAGRTLGAARALGPD